ncbi:adenylate/guanylate cyclase domain-containing protein [Aerosakkonema funiforme]|uniref:Adenylate cyclase n=1 Tax=Aerosakkonema funiforme FACHB-1375 TaxID=2949571 RepID=A0A926ZIF0_9CYAN|nr:adenylate/guanylate cyclase domain-containing protein [Aerosakkonema funiforme]MBD2181701.1 PAS domain S-box protein [Aerosakkonema funiforme FACHB-1375]
MKYLVIDKIFNKPSENRHVEYLAMDREFKIIDISEGVQRFADSPQEVAIAKDVREGFPELIGVEDILIAVIEGQQDSFEYKGIARFSNRTSPLYIDLYAIGDEDEKSLQKRLLIFFEDVTQKMVLEQNLVQTVNELHLLSSALTASKNYIDKILKGMADALFVTNSSGIIKTANKAAQDLFEYSESELINQEISKFIIEHNIIWQTIQPHLLPPGEFLQDLKIVCQTKTEKKIVVSFSCSTVETEIEGVKDLIYIGRDITERQRIEKRQLTQYATTRVLSDSGTVEQALPKFLRAVCESLGWTVGEFWMPEEDKKRRVGEAEFAHQSGVPYLQCAEIWSGSSSDISKLINITKQTTFAPGVGLPGRIWATLSPQWIADIVDDADCPLNQLASQTGLQAAFGFPIKSDWEVLGVMVFFNREKEEVDEDLLQTMVAIGSQLGQFIKRKRAETALAESEERYRDLFENASDLIQSVAADGNFIYVNRAWQETLGYTEAEIANLTIFDLIHPDALTHCQTLLQRVMSGEKVEQVKAEFLTKAGKKISVEGSINCKFVDGIPVATRAIFRDITQRLQAEAELRYQQEQTERLLLNILPQPIAERLKQEQSTIAENFGDVTVMFADIVGFTELSSLISPTELVEMLNIIFSKFDQLAEKHNLEKIKTIGDAYMVVGGLPVPRSDHAIAIAEMALDMQAALIQFSASTGKPFRMRIGINTGSVVAGVIGTKKFIYDLWGDTVNIASRMESHSLPGQIQVTEATYSALRDRYLFEQRGEILVKGKGNMTTYFLVGRKDFSG